MLEKGKFIKWTDRDAQGKFSYSGQIKSVSDEMVVFEDSNGSEYGIPKDEGSWESIKKPKGWKKAVADSVVTPAPKKAPVRRKGSSSPTKLDEVVALLRATPALVSDRKAAIKKIVADIGMTEAGASTYFSNAKKKIG